jgi:hypothetical protein
MDVATQIRLLWLGGIALLFGVALGMGMLLGRWLRRRERQRSMLLEPHVPSCPGEVLALTGPHASRQVTRHAWTDRV